MDSLKDKIGLVEPVPPPESASKPRSRSKRVRRCCLWHLTAALRPAPCTAGHRALHGVVCMVCEHGGAEPAG